MVTIATTVRVIGIKKDTKLPLTCQKGETSILSINGGYNVDIDGKVITNERIHISKLMEVEAHGHT